MSSRLFALGFCLIDALTTFLTFIHGSATLLLIAVSCLLSVAIALFSWMLRALIWPSSVWERMPQRRGM